MNHGPGAVYCSGFDEGDQVSERLPLHRPTEAFESRWLDVGDGHRIHVRQFGARDGQPVVALHGGPGSGHSLLLPRFFDPARYRIICPDQRGSGLSEPRGAITCNDTASLVADLVTLRRELSIDRWLVAGGSWGATLAICYAAIDRSAIAGLLLRGSFLARVEDVDWFFQGAQAVRPRSWARFAATAPPGYRSHLLDWLGAALIGSLVDDREIAAQAWAQWEAAMTRPAGDDRDVAPVDLAALADTTLRPDGAAAATAATIARYRVQVHYLLNGCWLRPPASLLERCAEVPAVPIRLLHGTEDVICRPEGADALLAELPTTAHLLRVDGAGHDPSHPALADAMVRTARAFAIHGRFDEPEG